MAIFDIFDVIQGDRKGQVGLRYYHPDCFQGSEEERRLDALIGYLDIIGYHYHHGLIRMKDVAAMLNYQLAAFASRKVIKTYLGEVGGADWWEKSKLHTGSGGAKIPYLYFRILLADFVRHNKKHNDRWKDLNQRSLDDYV